MPKGPLQIAVNISTQKVTLYSNGVRVAQGPVSTGVPGHPTPLGVFSIIEKDRHHHSNIYSGAPMPFMQRITWSGVALHEGALPGHPASHGCIRTSHDFAQKLWPVTKLGVRFIVSRHEVAPVEFEHPKLFVPKQKPPEARVAMNGATEGRGAPRPIRLAETAPQTRNDAAASALESADAPAIEERKSSEKAAKRRAAESLPSAQTGDEAVRATGTVAPLAPAQVPAPSAPAELRKSVEVPAAAPSAASQEGDDLAKPAPGSIRQARGTAREIRRAAGQAHGSGRGLREPQGKEDFRAAGHGADVRHADRDRGAGCCPWHSRLHRMAVTETARACAGTDDHTDRRVPCSNARAGDGSGSRRGSSIPRSRPRPRRRRSTAFRCRRKRSTASASS